MSVSGAMRMGEHIRGALIFLREIGATDINLKKSRHIHIHFTYGSAQLIVTAAGSPRSDRNELNRLRQRIRKAIRDSQSGRIPRS